jgi:hypothetical protein
MLLVFSGLAFEKPLSVIIGQSRSEGSNCRACIPRAFSDAAKILALVLSPIARISSLSVSTIPAPWFVRSRSSSVVLPTALTTTTSLFPLEYSLATESAARLIFFPLDRLDPPNLAIIRRRRRVRAALFGVGLSLVILEDGV